MRQRVRELLDDTILYLYQEIPHAVFPVDPSSLAHRLACCRYMTYDQLASVSGTSYEEIVKACASLDGSTQYDPNTGRYLIAVNTSGRYNASPARIRWTTAHELGHIAAGHFIEIAESGCELVSPSDFQVMEEEADYFAASFLAPIPAMKRLQVRRAADIRDWFGLSQTAAEYRWTDLRHDEYDQRLEQHFRLWYPRSSVKTHRRLHPRNLDIAMDDCGGI